MTVTIVNIFEAKILNKTNLPHEIDLQVTSGNAIIESGGGDLLLEKSSELELNIVITMRRKDLIGPKTPVVVGLFRDNELLTDKEVSFKGPGF